MKTSFRCAFLLVKVIDAAKLAGAAPIGLQVEGLSE